uniref:Uncharacterized protein n=1 Tax=Aureoumbra lagunensis TaxID=44058 RepID=A0A7S3NIE4_9STRA
MVDTAVNGIILAEKDEMQIDESRPDRTELITNDQINALRELFSKKIDVWANHNLPRRGVDTELDEFLDEQKLKRSQASLQLRNFKRASRPELLQLRVDCSVEELGKRIRARVNGVDFVTNKALDDFRATYFFDDPKDIELVRPTYFDACREELKAYVVSIVEKLIVANAECTARSASAAGQMAASFSEKRYKFLAVEKEKFMKDQSLVSKIPCTLHPHEPSLLFEKLQIQTYETYSKLLADDTLPDLKVSIEIVNPQNSEPRAHTLYYVVGWLLFKVKRMLSFPRSQEYWSSFYEANIITRENAQRLGLPTEIIERRMQRCTNKFKKPQLVEYASEGMYKFIWNVERVYVKLLTPTNLMAYGNELINKINSMILCDEAIMSLFDETIPDTLMHDLRAKDIETKELAHYILQNYHKMRGRDYVKSLMSKIHSAAKQRNSLRDGLAAVAKQPKASKSKQKRSLEQDDEEDAAQLSIEQEERQHEEELQKLLEDEFEEHYESDEDEESNVPAIFF